MSIKISISIFFSLTMLFACSKKIPTTQTVKKSENNPVAISSTQTGNIESRGVTVGMEKNLVAMLKRTPCFGKCPSYEVKLYDNGNAVYTGFAFVQRIGTFEAKITPGFIKRLQQEAAKNGYSTFSSKYPIDGSDIKDLPTTISFVRSGKKGIRVENNYDAPKELIEFENWLENEIQNLDWKAVR